MDSMEDDQHAIESTHDSIHDSTHDEVLELHECWALMRNEAYGRLAVTSEDGPDIFPINALVDGGTLVFRTASGSKLAALRADPRVAFEVDGYDPAARVAWSVVIRGTARLVSDQYEGLAVVELGVTPWQHGPKPEFLRVEPATVSGRRFTRTHRGDWSVPDVHRTTSVD